jgi:translation initiation factor IF-2
MSKKVFELAKDLDMGPLDLVEILKSKGFQVRNHMAELADADVEKFLGALKKDKETQESQNTDNKKKVVRKKAVESTKSTDKKVADKKVVEKKATDKKVESQSVELKKDTTSASKTTTKKKATVIRRKNDPNELGDDQFFENEDYQNEDELLNSDDSQFLDSHDEVENDVESRESLDSQVETKNEVTEPASTKSPAVKVVKASSGLRVVSKPEPRITEIDRTKTESVKGEVRPKSDISSAPKDRVHRFTPVYIPSQDPNHKKEVVEVKNSKQSLPPRAPGTGAVVELDDDKKLPDDDGTNKKRMGGLATMMSGKKAATSKSQVINVTRAEDELRSYMTLSGAGRPIYTQILRKREYLGPTQQTEVTEVKESKRVVQIHKGVELSELAKKLSVKFKDLIDKCLELNLLIKETDYVGPELATAICALYNYRIEDKAFDEQKIIGKDINSESEKSKFPVRPPVVAIMGHVDHGKTTLLDTIRKAKVAQGEAGGITQHIGAYSVKVNDGKTITFLDTPGHAAFHAMRQRGANATDVVVLVVAGDDGVMPQTRESIKFCENAGVPIIVAVNKMDKPGVNPDRLKQELSDLNLMPEDWGGQTQYVHISALKSQGIDELLDAILLQAEMQDLRANPKGNVEGIVIESKVEAGRGPMATILIQSGTLNKGDSIVVGETNGRARSLTDHTGAQLNSAGPSTPVQIFGLEETPSPGDTLNVVKNDREAKKISENRINERKLLTQAPEKKKTSLEDFFANASKAGEEKKLLNLIIRSDVQGSYEAIKTALETLGNNEVAVKVISGGVGPITDSDVQLGQTSGGFIIGFNMRPVTSARKMADERGVDIKNYSIIYELINDVKLALEGLLDPEFVEEFIGRAEVREVFNIPKAGVIAGSYVIDGKIERGCNIRLLRNGKIIHDGKMSSLKRFKDDAKEVKNGYECGISLENFSEIKSGDIFEAYMMVQKKRTLDDNLGLTYGAPKDERPVL